MSRTRRGTVPPGGVASPGATAREPMMRLVSLPAGERDDTAPAQARVVDLAKRALPPAGLDADGLERVWRRLNRARLAPARRALRQRLSWALGATLSLMISGGMVAAGSGAWSWPHAVLQRAVHRWRPSARPSDPRPGAARGGGAEVVPPTTENTATPTRRPATSVQQVGERAAPRLVAEGDLRDGITGGLRATRRSSGRLASSAGDTAGVAPGPPSALAAESELLLRALHQLRREHDPAACLRELDRYAAQFPSGILSSEADRARIDALLMAGRRADASAALSRVTLGDGARDRELLLIRAELSGQDDCPRALPDYERVLGAPGVPQALAARALWGRAVCRSRLGDEAGAHADLAAYLARYPEGSHTAAARARLDP